MSLPVVSIVTPTFNRVDLLPETVASVLSQTLKGIEYIIVNDGSTDGTAGYLATLGDRVTVINQANSGQTAAITIGFARARGRYLGYLSDDDILPPGLVERMASHLDQHPEVAAAFPNANLIDREGRVIQKDVCKPFVLEDVVTSHEMFIGPGAIVRREIYEKAGEWDSNCRLAPDMEFWSRVGSLGPIDLVDDVSALYRVHVGSMSVHGIVSEERVNEFVYIADKYFNGPFCPPTLRPKKNLSIANAYMMAARGHLRGGRYRQFVDALSTAIKHDPKSVNMRSIATIAHASVPLPLKQLLRRLLRRT